MSGYKAALNPWHTWRNRRLNQHANMEFRHLLQQLFINDVDDTHKIGEVDAGTKMDAPQPCSINPDTMTTERSSAKVVAFDALEDRLWARIESELDQPTPSKAIHFQKQRPRHLWPIATMVLAASLILTLWLQSDEAATPSASSPIASGIKSGMPLHTVSPSFRLKSLRFAVVNPDGSLAPGDAQMLVKAGSPIVFAVEAEGVEGAQVPAIVDLTYQRRDIAEAQGSGPDPSVQEVASRYVLKHDREILTGEHGYLALTLMEPGRYTFTITTTSSTLAAASTPDPSLIISESGQAKQTAPAQEASYAASFTIQITAP